METIAAEITDTYEECHIRVKVTAPNAEWEIDSRYPYPRYVWLDRPQRTGPYRVPPVTNLATGETYRAAVAS